MSKLPVLTKNKEFQRVYTKGKYSATSFLVIYVLPNRLNETRIGITASKKVGKSVERNRMRRLIRENIRLLDQRLAKGFDVVVIARKAEDYVNLHSIGKEMRYNLNKLDVLTREKDV